MMPPKVEALENRPNEDVPNQQTPEAQRTPEKVERESKTQSTGCDFSVLVNLGLL